MPRTTRQRAAISLVIQGARRPLTPEEVLEGARAVVRALGMATVYRNLKRLAAEGTVQVITLPGDIAVDALGCDDLDGLGARHGRGDHESAHDRDAHHRTVRRFRLLQSAQRP